MLLFLLISPLWDHFQNRENHCIFFFLLFLPYVYGSFICGNYMLLFIRCAADHIIFFCATTTTAHQLTGAWCSFPTWCVWFYSQQVFLWREAFEINALGIMPSSASVNYWTWLQAHPRILLLKTLEFPPWAERSTTELSHARAPRPRLWNSCLLRKCRQSCFWWRLSR